MTEEIKQEKQEKIKKTLEEMMEENLALTKEIHEMTHKIKRYITFQKFMSFIYFLLIVVPLVISVIYLPPLLKSVFEQYQILLNPTGQVDNNSGILNSLLKGANIGDLKSLSPELQKILDKK